MTSNPSSPPLRLGPDPGTGVSLRQAEAKDMDVLQDMYADLLAVLAEFNPMVDVTLRLQDDWIEKPDELYAWIIESDDGNSLPVGFALVCGERYAHALGSPTEYVLYEFLVTGRARRGGIGRSALGLLTDAYPGSWSLDVLPGNQAAMAFWSRVLAPHSPEAQERVDEDGVTFVRHAFEARTRGA